MCEAFLFRLVAGCEGMAENLLSLVGHFSSDACDFCLAIFPRMVVWVWQDIISSHLSQFVSGMCDLCLEAIFPRMIAGIQSPVLVCQALGTYDLLQGIAYPIT